MRRAIGITCVVGGFSIVALFAASAAHSSEAPLDPLVGITTEACAPSPAIGPCAPSPVGEGATSNAGPTVVAVEPAPSTPIDSASPPSVEPPVESPLETSGSVTDPLESTPIGDEAAAAIEAPSALEQEAAGAVGTAPADVTVAPAVTDPATGESTDAVLPDVAVDPGDVTDPPADPGGVTDPPVDPGDVTEPPVDAGGTTDPPVEPPPIETFPPVAGALTSVNPSIEASPGLDLDALPVAGPVFISVSQTPVGVGDVVYGPAPTTSSGDVVLRIELDAEGLPVVVMIDRSPHEQRSTGHQRAPDRRRPAPSHPMLPGPISGPSFTGSGAPSGGTSSSNSQSHLVAVAYLPDLVSINGAKTAAHTELLRVLSDRERGVDTRPG